MKKEKNLPVVLVVDDEPAVLESLTAILEEEFTVSTARSGKEALEKIAAEQVRLVFLDIALPDMDGMQVLRKIKEYDKNLSVIMATATDSARRAVEAMQSGACNYITKPFDMEEVITVARKALEQDRLIREVIYLRWQREEAGFDNIIGRSPKIREVFEIIEKVSQTNATVLIFGESGTGKELIARAIHFRGPRKQKPFIPINCAAIPENLLESELFGHEKGAFTDATSQKLGMFELADEGTLFLDEISGLRLDVQANLLRALEEKEIRRLGGNKLIKVDVRIISATNTDLKSAANSEKFREDLYYRLNVVPVNLPALRERREDIPLLVEYFLKRYNQAFRKDIVGLTKEAMDCLLEYDWPGNVRELKNIIERLAALKDGKLITAKDLPFDLFIKGSIEKKLGGGGALKQASKDFEKQYIEGVLERVSGNQTKAARLLGIHRNALFNKMKSMGLKK
ncbi:MAG: sigma-54 dependent transcriptional regulator [Candidatus Omnitrophica bacterium]|nr:sigma-54 dependent transcriptional regulator [Candidatus Omnitrophota bacterium]MDD5552811.1 sigma-54 dependent transcriptional regulator [Candidatus Omnitrophota bacterium]